MPIKTYFFPDTKQWEKIKKRPLIKEDVTNVVTDILNQVKKRRDSALIQYAWDLDGVHLNNLKVSENELITSEKNISSELKKAIMIAADNIRKFHTSQLIVEKPIETMPGVVCWRKNVAIEKVGLYIPGGTAPLFSTILMLAIPAQIAGCQKIILCSPANKQGQIHPAILYTAHFLGITEIYKVGGAQAIAALAYGTETIPSVDKILGPGNIYVTQAKTFVQNEGVAIDLPAGPSELLVIADKQAQPNYIAADLLSQAEHGMDSQVVFLTTEEKWITEVKNAIEEQLVDLPRAAIARQALEHSFAVLCHSLEECLAYANDYAPEHLILAVENPEYWAEKVTQAGSVFLGNYACESAGDYASGTNHTLPTHGYAKSFSGVSVDSFIKKITFQKISPSGLKEVGPTIEIMAEAESLIAHKRAVSIRLNQL